LTKTWIRPCDWVERKTPTSHEDRNYSTKLSKKQEP